MLRLALAALILLLAACPPSRPSPVGPRPVEPPPTEPPVEPPVEPPAEPPAAPPRITWHRAATAADVPAGAPPADTWRIHLIDVGTGLSLLVQGPDFTLLYDGGSRDAIEQPLRVVAYLTAALGPSGDAQCSTTGTPSKSRRRLDHLVLSHPHEDHASALALVLHCFDVAHVWEPGRPHEAVFYRDFLLGVAAETGAVYHTAADPPADRTVTIKGIAVTIPPAVSWVTFHEADELALGDRAHATILHAEAKSHSDPNRNSLVLAVQLGRTRLLLTGDAESGKRADPSAALGDVEAHLVDTFPALVDADVLQVGHHGSSTSSRRAFLDAVSPSLALVSSGPFRYKQVVLPDAVVLDALTAAGAEILRTDLHDADPAACPTRIGPPAGPGGCDAFVITIDDRAPTGR